MRARLLPFLAISAVAVTGCSKSIDKKKAEKFIDKTVSARNFDVKSVSCPDGLTAKKGETFDCTVTGTDGSEGKITVEEKDDQGNVRLGVPFLPITDIQSSMAADIKRQVDSDVKVDCPDIIRAEKGGTFTCQATSGRDKAKVNVTQTDANGHVTYKLVQ